MMYLDMSESGAKSKIRGQIDENLKRIYDETLNQQVPDKLLQLLNKLRQKSSQSDAEDPGEVL